MKNKPTDLMNFLIFIYKILAPLISLTVSMLVNNFSEAYFLNALKPLKLFQFIFISGDSYSTVNDGPISTLPCQKCLRNCCVLD